MKPKIIVIGCGAITEKFYAPALSRLRDRFESIAATDLSPDRINEITSKFTFIKASTLEAAKAEGYTAAIIATPNRTHKMLTLAALEAGMHVLVEKPLAENPEEGALIIEAARDFRKIVAVNQTRRFFPSNIYVREAIRSGRLGKLKSISFLEGALFNWQSVEGVYTKKGAGRVGVIADLGAHILDLVSWWTDMKLNFVSCSHDGFDGPEAFASIELSCGDLPVSVVLSRINRLDNSYIVEFENGILRGDNFNLTGLEEERRGRVKKISIASPYKSYSDLADVVIENFMDALTNDKSAIAPADSCVNSLNLIDGCYLKGKTFMHSWYSRISRI